MCNNLQHYFCPPLSWWINYNVVSRLHRKLQRLYPNPRVSVCGGPPVGHIRYTYAIKRKSERTNDLESRSRIGWRGYYPTLTMCSLTIDYFECTISMFFTTTYSKKHNVDDQTLEQNQISTRKIKPLKIYRFYKRVFVVRAECTILVPVHSNWVPPTKKPLFLKLSELHPKLYNHLFSNGVKIFIRACTSFELTESWLLYTKNSESFY